MSCRYFFYVNIEEEKSQHFQIGQKGEKLGQNLLFNFVSQTNIGKKEE